MAASFKDFLYLWAAVAGILTFILLVIVFAPWWCSLGLGIIIFTGIISFFIIVASDIV